MEEFDTLLNSFGEPTSSYSYFEMLFNMLLAIALGFVMAWVYRFTHKGLSYSQSFTLTILFVTLIVAIIMMIIGGSLARAFAMVGALSIIRFRTVVKDTKDTAYVFAGLAVGMAAGTSNYALALMASAVIVLLAMFTYRGNFGAIAKSEFILRFVFDQKHDPQIYLDALSKQTKQVTLMHMEPSGDGQLMKLTYDVIMKNDVQPEILTSNLAKETGISEVVMIAAKNDLDY